MAPLHISTRVAFRTNFLWIGAVEEAACILKQIDGKWAAVENRGCTLACLRCSSSRAISQHAKLHDGEFSSFPSLSGGKLPICVWPCTQAT